MAMKASNTKFEVEKFTGRTNFRLSQVKVRDLLAQQGLHKVLSRKAQKSASMMDED